MDHEKPSRRSVVGTILKSAAFAYPMGIKLLGEDAQPLVAQVGRLVQAMAYLGEPFSDIERRRLDAAANLPDGARASEEIQRVLDPKCLLDIRINPESRVSIERGAAPPRLVEQGWRAFLVKVHNEAGATDALSVESPQARPVYRPSTGAAMAPQSVQPADVTDRWLALETFADKPMEPRLSGLDLEYKIVLLYSRDRGRREAHLGALLGAGTEDIGFRSRTAVLFDVSPSRDVTLHVHDENRRPCMASFLIKDKAGRVYLSLIHI